MSVHLTLVEVLAIHDRLLADFGGATGVRDGGALESALHRPLTGYYDDVIAEAAALFESLLINHPFVDGNKRTAMGVVDVFLRLNGHLLDVGTDDAYELIVSVLDRRRDERFALLEDWLRGHLVVRGRT